MSREPWATGTFGPGGVMRRTWPAHRTVLAVVHNLTAGTRLSDVLSLVEGDPRVQIVYTVPPSSDFASTGDRFVRELDGFVLPWQQAVAQPFDLAVAASHGGLDRLHAPALVLPHGVGQGAFIPRRPGYGPETSRVVKAAMPCQLVSYGRVIPAAIGVPNERQRMATARTVPEAGRIVHVVGDLCHDRMVASAGRRDDYRRALGVRPGRRVVVVSSTWGPHSLLGRRPDLPARLVRELNPTRYLVVVVPHPGIWAWHGRRQLRAWLATPHRAGAWILPPEEGWRAALVAADLVIGDHGSVTCHAAALGRPLMLGAFPEDEVAPASFAGVLGDSAAHLHDDRPLPAQVAAAILNHDPSQVARFAALLTSVPGEAATRLRRLMYDMMSLVEPDDRPVTDPLPPPAPLPPLRGHTGDDGSGVRWAG